MKPSKMAFEQMYSDGSGVEYAIRLGRNYEGSCVEFEHVESVAFPVQQLPWIIAALQEIQKSVGGE